MANKRIKTYINGMDERMQGGIPHGSVVLISGRAGSMKSSVAFNILYKYGKETGGKSIYLSLEQSSDSLLFHMENLGFDTQTIEDMMILDLGQLRDISEGHHTEHDWFKSILTSIAHIKKNFGCELVVLDSMDALYTLSRIDNPRSQLFHFVEGLRKLDITTFLVSEIKEMGRFGQFGAESYLSDGIIHLDIIREGKNVGLYIGVAKMRATNHTRTYYPLLAEKGEFSIVTKS